MTRYSINAKDGTEICSFDVDASGKLSGVNGGFESITYTNDKFIVDEVVQSINRINEIGIDAFSQCFKMKHIKGFDKVKVIGQGAFSINQETSQLKSVWLTESKPFVQS